MNEVPLYTPQTGTLNPLGRLPPFRALSQSILLFPSLLLSSLELGDIKVYEPEIRARLGTAAHFCEVVVLKLRSWNRSVYLGPRIR